MDGKWKETHFVLGCAGWLACPALGAWAVGGAGWWAGGPALAWFVVLATMPLEDED